MTPDTISPTAPTHALPCGLTLWDFYAAHIIGGFAAGQTTDADMTYARMSNVAGQLADAMIAERAKRHSDTQTTEAATP